MAIHKFSMLLLLIYHPSHPLPPLHSIFHTPIPFPLQFTSLFTKQQPTKESRTDIQIKTHNTKQDQLPQREDVCTNRSHPYGILQKTCIFMVFWCFFYTIMSSLIPQYVLVVKGRTINVPQQLITINMLYHFPFDTQANLEEADYSQPHHHKHSLPTTTHNSPHHSDIFDREELDHEDPSECSFQDNCQSSHADAIWQAANAYVNPSNHQLGCQGEASMGVEEAICSNKLLRSRERSRLLGQLRREGELCGLLTQLMLVFSLPAFQEMLFLIHNLWQRHYLPFRARNTTTPLVPRLAAFVGWAEDEREVGSVRWGEQEGEEVRRRAEEGVEELARELFYSRKLRMFAGEGRTAQGRFLTFLQAVSKSLFLSAEGFYSDCWEECWQQQEQCRLVRAFSQIQTQHDGLQGTKRRKLE